MCPLTHQWSDTYPGVHSTVRTRMSPNCRVLQIAIPASPGCSIGAMSSHSVMTNGISRIFTHCSVRSVMVCGGPLRVDLRRRYSAFLQRPSLALCHPRSLLVGSRKYSRGRSRCCGRSELSGTGNQAEVTHRFVSTSPLSSALRLAASQTSAIVASGIATIPSRRAARLWCRT